MAAITTTLNPLLRGEEELCTFYINSVGALTLSQRSNPARPAEIIYQAAEKQTGNVRNPSSLVALLHEDMINVYGIVVSAPHGDVSLERLSPIQEPLVTAIRIEEFASLTGITDSTPGIENAWLYYLDTDDEDRIVINEYEIGNTDSPVRLVHDVYGSTYLASAYTKNNGREARLIFYQTDEDTSIQMLDAKTSSSTNIPNSNAAKRGTPIAACTARNSQGLQVTYVYFVDNVGSLWRSIISGSPGEATELPNAPKRSPYSQIAVTSGETLNYLSYIPQGSRNLINVVADDRTRLAK